MSSTKKQDMVGLWIVEVRLTVVAFALQEFEKKICLLSGVDLRCDCDPPVPGKHESIRSVTAKES